MWNTSNSWLDIDNLVILWYHFNFLIQHYSSLFLFLLKFICLVSMFFFFFLFFCYFFFHYHFVTFRPNFSSAFTQQKLLLKCFQHNHICFLFSMFTSKQFRATLPLFYHCFQMSVSMTIQTCLSLKMSAYSTTLDEQYLFWIFFSFCLFK